MNIAVIGNWSETLIRFRYPLLIELTKDHKVYAVSPSYNEAEKKQLQDDGIIPIEIAINRSSSNILGDIFTLCRLYYFFKKYHIDISFSYFLKPIIFSTLAAYIAGVKKRIALVEGLGYFFTKKKSEMNFKDKLSKNILMTLTRFTLPLNSKTIFLNLDDQELIEELSSKKINSKLLLGIGTNLVDFSFQEKFPHDRVRFVMVARIIKEKGIYEFIESSRYFANNKNVSFTLIGGLDQNPGSLKKSKLEELLLGSPVTWVGHVDDVRPFLKNCDVFVLPSYREGLPKSIQEALSMGCAILTTDVPGCRSTVVPYKNGLLIKDKDVVALTEGILFFINNKELIPKMGKESRKLAEERFDAKKQTAELMKHILK